MMDWVIAALYILGISYVLFRYHATSTESIPLSWKTGSFLLKVGLGFLNYYIWIQVIGHGDSLRYVHDSQVVYQSLFDNPMYFLQLLTRTSLEQVPEHLVPYQHALFIEWHVPEYNMVRILAVLNVFTFGSAWANIVLLCGLTWWAQWWFFRRLCGFIPAKPMVQHIWFAILFLLPSTLFWSSGLLKEGPILALLCILCGLAISWLQHPKEKRGRIGIWICLTLWGIYIIRDYLGIVIGSNILALIILHQLPAAGKRPVLSLTIFAVCVSGIIILLSVAGVIPDIFIHLKNEQSYFLLSGPDPDYTFHTLDGTAGSFFSCIPYAIQNNLFRPNILHSTSPYRIYQSLELLAVILFLVWILIQYRHQLRFNWLSAMILLMIVELSFIFGIMVTDADTLSRYRSIPTLALVLLASMVLARRDEHLLSST